MSNNSRKFIKVVDSYNIVRRLNEKGETLFQYYVKKFRYIPIDNILTITINEFKTDKHYKKFIKIIWEQKYCSKIQDTDYIKIRSYNQEESILLFFSKRAFEDKLKELEDILLVNNK